MLYNRSLFKCSMLAAALTACAAWSAAAAPAAEPLKMEGKSTLYQRVLTTPSCVLKANPADADGKKLPAFSRYYIYARENGQLQVGPDSTGKIAGYIAEHCTVPWKMQTALLFTNPANRDRALIFEKYETLAGIVASPDPKVETDKLYASLAQTQKAEGVVAEEPENYIDFSKNFYLLPILSSQEELFGSDDMPVNLLEIASVTDKQATADLKQQQTGGTSGITAFKAAMVFVIDSSISMQPYIDKTKEIIHEVYKTIEADGLQDSVQFGLVSFRSNTKATPGLEYTSKVFVKPGDVSSAADFEKKVAELKQATVSSVLFDEDAYSGVLTALSSVNWSKYGGRYVILITDAGAIEGSNQYSSTKMDAAQLRAEAEHYNAAIYAMHLLTPAGKKNHDKARAQYEDLTMNSILGKPLYYPVDAGNVQSFGSNISIIAKAITEQVHLASMGEVAAGSAAGMKKSGLEEDMELIGKAMRLRFLGTYNNETAPDIIRGFIADRDLVKHNQPTSQPYVLLTKAQLSDLYDVTTKLLEQANLGMMAPSQMFSNLLSLAAAMNNDAAQVTQSKTLKISEMGLLGEYLDDLPYKSQIAGLTEEDWAMMSPEEQDSLIRTLESKLEYYRHSISDTDRWLQLAPDAAESEDVYPVPLDQLP